MRGHTRVEAPRAERLTGNAHADYHGAAVRSGNANCKNNAARRCAGGPRGSDEAADYLPLSLSFVSLVADAVPDGEDVVAEEDADGVVLGDMLLELDVLLGVLLVAEDEVLDVSVDGDVVDGLIVPVVLEVVAGVVLVVDVVVELVAGVVEGVVVVVDVVLLVSR